MKKSRFEFKIDNAANCIFVRHFGVVDLQIILERGAAILKHKDHKIGLNRITDFTDTDVVLSSEDIRVITDKISTRLAVSGNFREAVIVDNLLGFGLARVFYSLSAINENEYEIFNQENSDISSKVKSWVKLPSDYILPDFLNIK